MKLISVLSGAVVLAGLSFAASAQAPPGSYQQSCRDIRMQGPNLTAFCRRIDGREQPTGLNIAHCVGDIGNNNGNLMCNGGQPAPPPRLGAEPGYPPPPGYGEEQAYRERCEHAWREEHELRDRLAYAPYGEERQRIEDRLGRLHAEREECWRR
jgi:hypothetical protein